MTLTEIAMEWYNAIFAVMFCTGIMYSLVYAVIGHGEDSDADHDMDHDVDHDIDQDADHDVEHDQDTDPGDQSIFAQIFSFLGVGRCPISIILIVLFITWGFIGLASNAFFISLKIVPYQIYFWFSLTIATVLGIFLTRHLSIFVAKLMPKMGTSAVKVEALVGQYGEAKVSIDSSGGYANVSDEYGTLHNICCKTIDEEAIGVNEAILVLQYLPDEKAFIVTKKPKITNNH